VSKVAKVFSQLDSSLLQKQTAKSTVHAADREHYVARPRKAGSRINDRVKTWVVLSDIHYPEQDRPSIAAVLDFLQKNRKTIHGVVLLGDNLDCQSISRHTEGLPGLRKEGGFQEDLVGFDAAIMTPIEKLLPDAKKVWFEGNHEAWLTHFLEKEPQFKGALSFPRLLQLAERGWQFVPQGETFYVGVMGLKHGDGIGSSMHVAKKLVDTQCQNSMMGHVHTFSAYTKTSESDKGSKWVGYTLPCLTNTNPKYGKGRPNTHIHGFGIIDEWSNGYVNVFVPIILKGRFSYGGVLYGARS
jgi:hypothetical protein